MEQVRLVVEPDDFPGWVEQLADPARAKRAYWHLVGNGPDALAAVRAGLAHPHWTVRDYCTKALDHLADADSFGALVGLLDDPHPRVRADALHAIACDRCNASVCRPTKGGVLPAAIRLLTCDPNGGVRCHAVEVVGRFAHGDGDAAAALIAARDADASPTVRKKAGWYAPGGPIYLRTAQRRRPTRPEETA
jgi:HEAT repeat protein